MTDQTPTVARIRAQFPTPLGAQHAACLLAIARAIGQRAGLLKKSAGAHVTLPDGTDVSQDIIMFPDGQIYDCLGNSEGAATPVWSDKGVLDPAGYYAVNGGGTTPDPQPDLTKILARLDALEIRMGDAVANGSRIALRTDDRVHYVCAEAGGGGEVNATRVVPGGWETFTVEKR